MFSAIVYRGEKRIGDAKPTPRPTKTELKDKCDREWYEGKLSLAGWQRRGRCDRNCRGDGQGLYFEVWENDERSPRQIVFAFRGTRAGPDWAANFRWLRFHKPRDHYLAALEECRPLIQKYYDEPGRGKPIISTTGHSLGGGLAQEVFYAFADKIDHCTVFDPSPITALHDLNPTLKNVYRHQLNRSEFSQYRIIRAYERGEILMYVRNILELIRKPDSQTQSIEFKTPGRFGAVGRHSITLLANHVISLAEERVPAIDPPKWKELTPALRPATAYEEDSHYHPENPVHR
jgi:hypothetical protein